MDTPIQRAGVAFELTVNRSGDLQRRPAGVELGASLLALAGWPDDAEPTPAQAFGRGLARQFLSALWTCGDLGDRMAPARLAPPPGLLPALQTAAPPMPGREHLTIEGLRRAWDQIGAAVVAELAQSGASTAEYLRSKGVVGSEVGRVYFHLAEQKADPAHPFAFMATYARGQREQGRVQHAPLRLAPGEFAADRAGLLHLLAPLQRAAEASAVIRRIVDSHEVYHPLSWTAAEAYALLRDLPAIEAAGIVVRVPDWWRAHRTPRPQLRVELGNKAPKGIGLEALLDFKLGYFLDDEALTSAEWKRLLKSTAGLHLIKGRWVELDPERLSEALQHWKRVEAAAARGELSFAEGMRLLANAPPGDDASDHTTAWSAVTPGPWLASTLAALQSPAGAEEADPGPALRADLRPYQREGVAWLWLVTRLGLGACLADDMGLGKTVQVIALLLLLRRHKAAGPHLIVMPASLLGNWQAELARFAPSLRVHIAHRSANDVPADEPDVVLTTYGSLLRQPTLTAQTWGLVALDEAQAIKNAGAKQTRAVKSLHCRHRLTMTGTPVENDLADLWSLFDFTSPGLLGDAAAFKAFARRLADDPRGFSPLRRLVRPYILRRLKTDRRVIADLPDKTEIDVNCGLTRPQAALYAQAVSDLAHQMREAEGIQRRGLILAFLTRFKQICNHPSHYSGDGNYATDASAKFMRLRELAVEISTNQEKALIFTQFREITDPLAALLADAFDQPGLVLHGQTPVKRRGELVAAFQRPDGPPFMVLSLKAGGTGLNLTAASHVVHFDRWWNPAVENQATDRAFRIGQHRNVLVHKFICRGTLEERIDAMLRSKSKLADDVLADVDGERRLTELSTAELMKVVALDLNTALTED
ncbi:MAG: DEAD/DEAH box helicase [Nannocystis sp.]|nr:DEAD/DEAH box helicase [Nannocystis sp.]MBA3549238.1 DEAD/DEAH box helicase [Nannocystis sp.]